MPNGPQQLSQLIRSEIAATGPMPFARFMQLALYHPTHGYYRRPMKQIGCQGDFCTSVSAGPLFGQLLARQFTEWLQARSLARSNPRPPTKTGARSPFQLVEAGAHDGRLALDILSWFETNRPGLLRKMEYWILEPSTAAREAQRQLLKPFQSRVRWSQGWADFPLGGVCGIIFCNELLDAFPVARLGWNAGGKTWFEWRVTWSGDRFAWARGPGPDWTELGETGRPSFWQTLPLALQALLPDGFTIEICPAARAWWSQAAANLKRGKLLTFDYGLESIDFLAPHRTQGTLRSYRAHRLVPDPLADPGAQDLTAHVNFSVLKEAGEKAGLTTEFFDTQAAFLTRIADRAAHRRPAFEPWTAVQRRQFQTLTHPDYLGQAFRVLAQGRE
jgi:SAM-dependent MidA family methyltransferase